MKYLFSLLLTSTVFLPLHSQTTQKGQVRELNSNKRPIPGTQIIFADASSEISGSDGGFTLVFQNKKPGDLIFKERIHKQGYELVNEKDFDIVKIGNTDQLGVDIILALAGTVDAAKKEYYDVSDAALLASFNREKSSLRQQLEQARISQGVYANQLQNLQEQYNNQQKELDRLAEKFARVNFDDVSNLYREALDLYKAGKIDEAIHKLESAKLGERTQQIINEQKRIQAAEEEISRQKAELEEEKKEQIEQIQLLAELYALNLRIDEAVDQFDQLLRLDSTDLNILQQAGDFFQEHHRYDRALQVFAQITQHPEVPDWQKANAKGHLGELYALKGRLPISLNHTITLRDIYRKLSLEDPVSSFFKGNLAISYSKLGETYTSLGQLDSALTYFQERSRLGLQLYQDYPQNVNFKNGLAISYEKLGSTYTSLGQLDSALTYFIDETGLFVELYQDYPQNVNFKNGLAISYEKLGSTYTSLGQLDSALTYFIDETGLFVELYQDYPQNVNFKNGLAISYEKLGSTYTSLGQLDSALTYFIDETGLFVELYQDYPQNVNFKNGLAISYEKTRFNLHFARTIGLRFDLLH